jgi:hypothetical protein
MNQTSRRGSRRVVAAVALAVAALAVAACTPPDTGTPGTTTTTTPPVANKTVTNATLEWTISREADNGSFAPGQVNYWSAGISDSTAATYVPTNGNVTVLKKNASGTYVPIGSEAAVSWANRSKDGNGNSVTATNAFFLGQKVRFTGGTGTVNPATGVSTIQWTGTFTINFYGSYTPFWIVNPKLTVAAGGAGQLTATLGGIGSDQDDPSIKINLPTTPNVVLANIPSVYTGGAIATGFTKAPGYLNTSVTSTGGTQVAKTSGNSAYWGAWPQSFVNFADLGGHGLYWFTSGGTNDGLKVQEPISIAYTLNP